MYLEEYLSYYLCSQTQIDNTINENLNAILLNAGIQLNSSIELTPATKLEEVIRFFSNPACNAKVYIKFEDGLWGYSPAAKINTILYDIWSGEPPMTFTYNTLMARAKYVAYGIYVVVLTRSELQYSENNIPTSIGIRVFESDHCNICYDEFDAATTKYAKRCGHLYCKTCIIKINYCAICRTTQ